MCEKESTLTDDLKIFNEITNTKSSDIDELDSLPWKRYGAYKLFQYIKRFFSYKPKPPRELNLEDMVGNLLSPFAESGATIPEEILNKCKELLQHQRTLEDTRARRRLEHWATRIISYYLITVFIILILSGFASVINTMLCQFCGISHEFIKTMNSIFLSDKVLIVLLSTTTINIIGLGLIVLRGHFGDINNNKVKDKQNRVS